MTEKTLMDFIPKRRPCDICAEESDTVFIIMELDERLELCSKHGIKITDAYRKYSKKNVNNQPPIEDKRKFLEMLKNKEY